MHLTDDWRQFIESLNSNSVEFLVVGAFAVAWHGHPRLTGDIDFLIRPSVSNAASVISALRQFGFGQLGIGESDITKPDQIIQLGFPPNQIDLITSISGVSFDEAWAGKCKGQISGLPVYFIGLDELIQNKESTGRPQDTVDASRLRKRNPRP